MVSRAGKWVGRVSAAAIVAALSLTMGCGNFWVYPGNANGTGTGANSGISGDVVYVANATAETVSAFQVGTGGTLAAVTNSPYALGYAPSALVVTPADTFLYVGSATGGVYGYSIGSGGVLSALSSTCASSSICQANVQSMVVSPDGQWLLILDALSTSIDLYQINPSTGQLSNGQGVQYAVTTGTVVPRAIAITPSVGNNSYYLYAALGTGGTIVYTFNTSTAAFTNFASQPSPSSVIGDNALALSPNGAYLYIARSGSSAVQVFSVGSNGGLTPGNSYATGNRPYSMVVNTAGTDMFIANQADGTISGYSVSGATLTPLSASVSAFTAGLTVQALAIDSTQDFLLAASNGGQPDLALYSLASMATGDRSPSTTTATGTDPTGPYAIATTH
jgi:6-phosphogluconolactonase